jgi:membrane fusion protein, adhesin transport system
MTTLDPALTEVPERPGRVIRLIGLAFAAFLVWAALAPVDEIVRAEGQAVSTARPQIIQNLEGGILAELMVTEGETVEAGAPLARLHATQYQSTVDDLRDQIATLELRRLRLEAEMTGQDVFDPPADLAARLPAIAASESALLAARLADAAARIEGARQVAKQADRERDLLEAMLKQEVVPLIEVTRARKIAADAQNRLNDAVAQTELERAQTHADTLKELGTAAPDPARGRGSAGPHDPDRPHARGGQPADRHHDRRRGTAGRGNPAGGPPWGCPDGRGARAPAGYCRRAPRSGRDGEAFCL